nr:cytochrome c oxidase subunit 7B, mitochondrial-like [Gorilla gorilla gorilla]
MWPLGNPVRDKHRNDRDLLTMTIQFPLYIIERSSGKMHWAIRNYATRALLMRTQQLHFLSSIFTFTTFPLVKNSLSRLHVPSIWQTMARQSHQKRISDFHDKDGNAVLASGDTVCIAVWTYVATQITVKGNLSAVGRVTLKKRRDQ